MNIKGGTIAAVCTAALLLSGCPEPRQPDYPETETVSSFDGVDIHYRVRGVGNFTLVMVHNWCGNMTYWKHQIPAFSSGYKIVTIDLAGHGLSGAGRDEWTIDALAEDVAGVVKRLREQNVILIGHGLGGPVVLEAAAKLPEAVIGVVGVDTFKDHYMESYTPRQVEFVMRPWREDFQGRMRDYVLETLFPDHVDEELKKTILLDMLDHPSHPALDILESLLEYDGSQGFAAVDVPIHSINSMLRASSYQTAERHAENFSYIYQSQAGHFPMMENPDFFNKLLAGVLEDIIMKMYQRR